MVCKKLLFTMRLVTFCETLKLLQGCFNVALLPRNPIYLRAEEIEIDIEKE